MKKPLSLLVMTLLVMSINLAGKPKQKEMFTINKIDIINQDILL
ncbi:MAG: hypothetical protein QS99_C0009G0004 [archaeon GW2011_AR4]|nr:MAG: hypothetical protein QS99_C0009G0004 [archaeon GW2011_AR4]